MSRAAEIPDNLMGKWQSDQNRGNKATRRPMTACQTCRASKVKCDGKQRCRHCTLRGVACVYANSKSTTARQNGAVQKCHQKTQMMTVADDRCQHMWPAPLPTSSSREIHGVEHASSSDNGNTWNQNPFISSGTATYRNVHYSPNSAVSRFNSGLGTMEPAADYNPLLSEPDMQLDFSCSIDMRPSIAFSEFNPNALYSIHQTSIESAVNTNTTSPGSSGPYSKSPSDRAFFSAHCICRDRFSKSVKEINHALSKNTMSDMFHVTSEFLHTCRGVLECTLCTVQYTDLVCLITFFQQTGSCFHYIAATDPTLQLIRLRLADTVVPVTDPRMRLDAVTNLVQYAIDILDFIGKRGRFMLHGLSPPTPLVLANIGYLENTISDLKTTLDYVVAIAEQNACQGN